MEYLFAYVKTMSEKLAVAISPFSLFAVPHKKTEREPSCMSSARRQNKLCVSRMYISSALYSQLRKMMLLLSLSISGFCPLRTSFGND